MQGIPNGWTFVRSADAVGAPCTRRRVPKPAPFGHPAVVA
jgi:hypothetical protein